jgi:phosphoribosyl 1,2-cyclic phosphodiesterase
MRKPSIKILASSSRGNSYIITTEDGVLLIELGHPLVDVFKTIDYKISNIQGVLVTHAHSDHAKYVRELADGYGVAVYSTEEVADKCGILRRSPHCPHVVHPKQRFHIGKFSVLPLSVEHSTETYAYVIQHPQIGVMVFATDCIDFPYNVKGCNHLFIEANYSDEIIMRAALDGVDIQSRSQYHMELDTTLEVIERHNAPELRNVVLLHLSDRLSNEDKFIAEAKRVAPFADVYAASGGMELELSKDPF